MPSRAQSKAGLRLLRAAGLSALPGLRYSAAKGVLVFAGHQAFVARAHVAALRAPRSEADGAANKLGA